MALSAGDPLYDAWWEAMNGGAMPAQPLAIESPELQPVPPQPPPPPPPPPPQQPIGGRGARSEDVQAQIGQTVGMGGEELPRPTLPPPIETLPDPPMPAPELDAYGLRKETAIVPQEQDAPLEANENVFGVDLDGQPGAVGHQRTAVGEGERALSTEEILRLDPRQQALYYFDENQKREEMANARMAEIQRTDAARQEQAERTFLDAQEKARQITDAAIADSNALAQEKPKKFTDSPWNVLSGLAGIFVSSLSSVESGAKAVSIVQDRMDRFAKEQVDEYNRKAGNVDRRLNIAARLRDAGYSDYQAANVIRMAGLTRMRDQLLTDLQQFDPKGTAAMKRAQVLQETNAALAKGAEEMRRSNLDMAIKEAELANKQLDVKKKAGALGGGAGAGTVKAGNFTGAQVTAMLPPGSDPVPDKAGGWTPAEAKSRVELAGKVTEEERKTRGRMVSGIVGADGNDFEFASEKEGEAFRKKKAALANLNALIGEVAKDIDDKGGTIKFFNSGQNKKYQSRLAQIDLELKGAFEMGALDKGSLEVAEKLKGGDPTSVLRGGTEGLDALRDGLVRRFNFELDAQPNYDGPGFKPAYAPRLPSAKETAEQQEVKNVVKSSYLSAKQIETAREGFKTDINPLGAKEHVDFSLDKWAKQAREGTDEGIAAREALRHTAANAISPQVKKRAQKILDGLPRARTDEAR